MRSWSRLAWITASVVVLTAARPALAAGDHRGTYFVRGSLGRHWHQGSEHRDIIEDEAYDLPKRTAVWADFGLRLAPPWFVGGWAGLSRSTAEGRNLANAPILGLVVERGLVSSEGDDRAGLREAISANHLAAQDPLRTTHHLRRRGSPTGVVRLPRVDEDDFDAG